MCEMSTSGSWCEWGVEAWKDGVGRSPVLVRGKSLREKQVRKMRSRRGKGGGRKHALTEGKVGKTGDQVSLRGGRKGEIQDHQPRCNGAKPDAQRA